MAGVRKPRMAVSHLRKDEVEFELAVRGLDTKDKDAEDLRSLLRPLLRAERKGEAGKYPKFKYETIVEFPIIERKYFELLKEINRFQDPASRLTRPRLYSRICHVLNRINHAPLEGVAASVLATRSSWVTKVSELFSRLEQAVGARARVGQFNLSEILVGESGVQEDTSEDSGSSEDEHAVVFHEVVASSVPVHKWGLTFNGDTSQSVASFVERVDELRVARNISERVLFNSATDLFAGKALTWFRSVRNRVNSWRELADLLKSHYLPPDYRIRLFMDLLGRTQGPREQIRDYLAVMTVLFNRHGGIPDDVRLSIISRNLTPFYLKRLPTVSTLEQLEMECLKLEARKFRVDNYKPPSSRVQDYVEPSLACDAFGSDQAEAVKATASSLDKNKNCFRCHRPGHFQRNCPDRKVKCFKCSSSSGTRLRNTATYSRIDRETRFKLDFILANAMKDERPYLTVTILGVQIMGLLDSGATRTVLGGVGYEFCCKLGLRLDRDSVASHCTVANGESCEVLGSMQVPFRLRDKLRVISVLVVPSVRTPLILGTDFWRRMGIVPDLRHGEWNFSSQVELNAIQDCSELSNEQRARLEELVREELPVAEEGKIGCTNLVEHAIRTKATPIKQRYYPLSPTLLKHAHAELEDMLKNDIVEPSSSPWSSPIVLVRKKDDTYRFCVDFRKVNAVTERDAYPLPYVSNILDRLRDATYLSSLDIKSAFHQVPVEEASRPLTAFTVPGRGLFQFKRMPFGLHNSPATWQRLIDRVIGADLEPFVFVYLDDIVIVSSSFEEHLRILREIFRRLKKAGLTVSREKCHLARSELKYLGYVVDKTGLHVDPSKVEAILRVPEPRNVKEIRSFLGMASWYRRFVPNFASIVAPLSGLLKKNKKFEWTESCTVAFGKIKDALVSAPVLSCPDFERTFVIQTDASDYGIGALISQDLEDGEHVIAYVSRSLDKRERNYSVTEKECLAVLFAIEKFRPYVEGSHFKVITDHYSLKWLNNLKDPTGRLARWSVKLQQYDYEVIHRSGKLQVVADALSRSVPVIESITPLIQGDSKDRWYNKLVFGVKSNPLNFPLWRIENGILYRYSKSEYPDLVGSSMEWKIVVPKERRQEIMKSCHDGPLSGHLGVFKTYHRVAEKYYWPKMRSDIARYVRLCRTCIVSKPEQKRPAGLMCGRPEVSRPWELICIDLVGPLPKSNHGNMYILTVLDYFSKFFLTFPLRTANAKNIVKLLEDNVICTFGAPRTIVCDNGKQLISSTMRNFANDYGIHLEFTAVKHPQSNAVERAHKTLATVLRSYVYSNHRLWDVDLQKYTCAMRSSVHEATGQTPYFVLFGRQIQLDGKEPLAPVDTDAKVDVNWNPVVRSTAFRKLYGDVRKRLDRIYERNRHNYNLRRRDVQYQPGDKVWKKNFPQSNAAAYKIAKFEPKFVGPFLVKRRLSPWTYELESEHGKSIGKWHSKDLKPDPLSTDVTEEG